MHVRIVFFDIFRLPCICCGCISVSEAQSGTGCTAHCPGSLHRHILLSISTLPDLLSGLLVASSASSGIRKKCIPDSVRCLEQLSIQFISCITNKVNKYFLSFMPDTLLVSSFASMWFFQNEVNVPPCFSLHFLTICLHFHFLFSSLFVFRRQSTIECLSGHPSVKGG